MELSTHTEECFICRWVTIVAANIAEGKAICRCTQHLRKHSCKPSIYTGFPANIAPYLLCSCTTHHSSKRKVNTAGLHLSRGSPYHISILEKLSPNLFLHFATEQPASAASKIPSHTGHQLHQLHYACSS